MDNNRVEALLDTDDIITQPDDNDHEALIGDDQSTDKPAEDKYMLVYFIFILLGMAVLLPWNIFITATEYFVDYKLNTTESFNSTYRTDFTFYVSVIGQSTSTVMNFFNLVVTFGGNPKNRIPYTIVLCALVTILHLVLALVDSSGWPWIFFLVTCGSVFFMNVATGIMTSCVFYIATIFSMEYTNAVILGTNITGIFTTFASIISKATTPNFKLAGMFYFLSAFMVLLFAFLGYFLMHKTTFYRYYSDLAEKTIQQRRLDNQEAEKRTTPYFSILKQTWILLFCLWFNFLSTLAIFPVYELGVEMSSDNFIIPRKWFQDVTTFLTFNVLVTIGNVIPDITRKPGVRCVCVGVIVKTLLVLVFFAFVNFKPDMREHVPVLIKNDYVYWLGCALASLSSGYFTSLIMMYAPRQVSEENSGAVSMIASLTIGIGVISGIQFYKIYELIVLI